ncbi:hypothetical protein HMF8227_01235 [Saliniradius amylolyticus]|uniref:Uncharacterized protein n=1 Tax=Saliniradius amylolyticus TaxID=2183582 RepID=A0A2S2E242_9ALTE|nr:hypothetical protein [Saliniradius amylolyticus]AWL11716.1 hypothetical protein HMF8227_01235 [Saliniradius amylolyticus]
MNNPKAPSRSLAGRYLWIGALVGFVLGVFFGFIYGKHVNDPGLGLLAGILSGTGLGLMSGVIVAQAKRVRQERESQSKE